MHATYTRKANASILYVEVACYCIDHTYIIYSHQIFDHEPRVKSLLHCLNIEEQNQWQIDITMRYHECSEMTQSRSIIYGSNLAFVLTIMLGLLRRQTNFSYVYKCQNTHLWLTAVLFAEPYCIFLLLQQRIANLNVPRGI